MNAPADSDHIADAGDMVAPDAQPIGGIVRDVVRGIVLSQIATCPDAAARRRRIDVAHAEGLITDAEAAEHHAILKALAA